jgi:hypothetical protein
VHSRGVPAEFDFRCDSPDQKRYMRMRLSRRYSDQIRFTSWLLSETPAENPLLNEHAPAPGESWSGQLLTICSMCLKLQSAPDHWLEIEEAVGQLDLTSMDSPRLSHGLCPDCYACALAAVEPGDA